MGATRRLGLRQKVPFILASCVHGTMILTRLDYRRLSDTHNEFGVGTDILVHGEFDLDMVSITGGLLQARRDEHGPGVLALDIGANIGVYSVEWGRLMTGWGSILAFEPQERIYYALAGNIAINNLFNVRALNCAVGRWPETIDMPVPDYQIAGQYGGLNLQGNADIGQKVVMKAPVQVIAIDGQGLPRVDFIKIDVEGMEEAVLEGAVSTIKRCQPWLLVEWHITGKEPIEKFLASVGYESVGVGLNMICGPAGDPFLPQLQAMLDQNAPVAQ